jgi:hypothetical protein
MSFSILSRYSGAVLYASATADTIADAVVEAVKNGANLYGANLTRANLYGANLDGANLDGANLDGANLYGANLYGANLTRANLYGANLDGANLDGANLYGANLTRANLYGANLDGANLTRANLYGANLDGANLYGANLDGANLTAETKIDRVAIVLIGSRHVITAYADRVRIGCHERSYESWLKIYRKVGEEEGYTPEQIDEYGDLIRRAQAMVAAIPTEVSE